MDTLEPPFTNRWGTKPEPDYRRCQGITKAGTQCRGAKRRFHVTCEQHSKKVLAQKMKAPPDMLEADACAIRAAALREAADLCDELEYDCMGLCAKAIRALLDAEKEGRGVES